MLNDIAGQLGSRESLPIRSSIHYIRFEGEMEINPLATDTVRKPTLTVVPVSYSGIPTMFHKDRDHARRG